MVRGELQDIIEKMDVGVKVRSYSGRGMFGKTCLGVVVRRGDELRFLVELGYAIKEADGVIPERMNQDSMGLDSIIYFPSVSYDDSSVDDDDDDDDSAYDADGRPLPCPEDMEDAV